MPPGSPDRGGDGPPVDIALSRLESALSNYDLDRALPALETILRDAGVGRDLLHEDDRAAKLLHEAILARPLSSLEAVERVRTEVELLSLEVSVLRQRLDDPRLDEEELTSIQERLAAIGESFRDLREDL